MLLMNWNPVIALQFRFINWISEIVPKGSESFGRALSAYKQTSGGWEIETFEFSKDNQYSQSNYAN